MTDNSWVHLLTTVRQSLLVGLAGAFLAGLISISTQEVRVDFTLSVEQAASPTELYYASPNVPYHQRLRHTWGIERDGWNNFAWRYRGPLSINSIRIDPIRSTGDIYLGSVRIAGPYGERRLQGPDLLNHMHELNHLEVREATAATLHLVSIGVDPHFSLDVPRDLYRPDPAPFLARLLGVFLITAVVWSLIVGATRPLRTWLSGLPQTFSPELHGRMPLMVLLPTLVSVAVLTLFVWLLATTAWGYGFWRHDAWGYRADGLREFQESARWLAFLLHGHMKQVPHLVAWYAALFSFAVFVFLFLRRFLAGTGAPLILILLLTFTALIQPGLMSQLNWPIHSLTAFLPLAILAFATHRNSSLWVVFVATILIFSILQSYAFLALLFGIPSYVQLGSLRPGALIRRFAMLLVVWIGSIGIAHVVSRLAQIQYFGRVPAMPRWRAPDPATDLVELVLNLSENIHVFRVHLSESYLSIAVFLLGAAIIIVFIAKTIVAPRKHALYFAVLSGVAALLSFSVYLFTSPVGTFIPFRASGTLGMALAFLLALLFAGAGSIVPNAALRSNLLAVFVLLLTAKPFALAYANMQWFAAQSGGIREALAEIAERPAEDVSLVLIDSTHAPLWPTDGVRHLGKQPLVFEPIDSRMRIAPAFAELGYNKILWCFETGASAPEPCQQFNFLEFAACASGNPRLCSAGYSHDGVWYVRF